MRTRCLLTLSFARASRIFRLCTFIASVLVCAGGCERKGGVPKEDVYLLMTTMMGLEEWALTHNVSAHHPSLEPSREPDVQKMMDVVSSEVENALGLHPNAAREIYTARLGRPLGQTEKDAIKTVSNQAEKTGRRWTVQEVAAALKQRIPPTSTQ